MNANVKTNQKSKTQLAIETRIAVLEAKQLSESLTRQELLSLANAYEKLESKKISRVYRELELKIKAKDATLLSILGKAKFPTFKEWAAKMPEKFQYSYWDGLQCLSKFNKIAVTKSKAVKQNKKVAAI